MGAARPDPHHRPGSGPRCERQHRHGASCTRLRMDKLVAKKSQGPRLAFGDALSGICRRPASTRGSPNRKTSPTRCCTAPAMKARSVTGQKASSTAAETVGGT